MLLRDRIDEKVLHDTEQGWHRPPEGFVPDTILDLGCHMGLTMLDLHRLYPEAFIAGIEMDKANARYAHLITKLPVVWAAISNFDGASSYDPRAESWAYRLGELGLPVPTMTLTSLLDAFELQTVDYLKIDIEGSEQQLFSFGDWPSRVRCLKVEIHEPYTPTQAATDLRKLGFDVRPTEHPTGLEAWNSLS